ncbi:MAG: thioredoxin domain-containing protein [Deltaproteobacteria bacterium]|nr:thioredoxin domain-containing protein [Deltaproteobacteria bacterium]
MGDPFRPTRREFAIAASVLLASCGGRTPRVPTRAAPSAIGGGAELLDTDDGTIPIGGVDPQRGSRDAHVVLVAFSDFECPYSRELATTLRRLSESRPKRLRIVFKHLPAPGRANALAAAIATELVFLEAGSEAFWRMHDRCFDNQRALNPARFGPWAMQEGVTADAMLSRMPEAERAVSQHLALAKRLGLGATPHLYLNERSIRGVHPYERLRDWVDERL